jgi:formylglycine-generating enzyme required for sulfatase activity
VRELAINPLMLTVIALVHRDRVKLPDRRAELYAEAVDVLLGKWDEARGVDEIRILDDRTFDAGDRRLLLQSIALKMHEAQTKEIEARDLREQLKGEFKSMTSSARIAVQAAERFLAVIQERTGLLVEAGQGIYRFSHLTFQEYLAALAILARDDYVEYTLNYVPETWWREAVLLEIGQLSTQSRERTTRLIQQIADLGIEPVPYYNLVLALEALRDVGTTRVDNKAAGEIQAYLKRNLEKNLPNWAEIENKNTLKTLMEARGNAIEALARSGAAYWSLPYGEPEWLTIPAGEFWIGEEKVEHRVFVPEFQIARVPITNTQYQLFVQATGAQPPEHWEDGLPPKGETSHPVGYMRWHDTLAYCEWLGKVTGKAIRLPTEAEWEKAARGDKDKRVYPWGDKFASDNCNSSELGLGNTSPVGVFPAGASPYGVLDMAGNVWEWCSSLYKPYPYKSDDGRENPNTSSEAHHVARGGSFVHQPKILRCTYRLKASDLHGKDLGFRVVCSPGPGVSEPLKP